MSTVKLPDSVHIDLYVATGIPAGTKIVATNITPNDVNLYHSQNQPTKVDTHLPLIYGRDKGVNDTNDLAAWALCVGGGAIDVKVYS